MMTFSSLSRKVFAEALAVGAGEDAPAAARQSTVAHREGAARLGHRTEAHGHTASLDEGVHRADVKRSDPPSSRRMALPTVDVMSRSFAMRLSTQE